MVARVSTLRRTTVITITTCGGLLRLGLREILDVHEGGLLLQHLRREVVHVGTRGGEAEVKTIDVDTEVEVLFLSSASALDGEVEHTEFAELDLLAFEQLFEHTLLKLVGDTETDIFAIDGVVLRHVLTELLVAHGLLRDYAAVPLAEGLAVLDLVLGYFDKYRHDFLVKSE